MFPLRRLAHIVRSTPLAKADLGDGKIIMLHGSGINDRVAMVFAMASISLTEDEAKRAAANVQRACPGHALDCMMRGIANALWETAEYTADEGTDMGFGEAVDVYRTFKRVQSSGRYDCDCASGSIVALGHLLGLDAGVRVIEQKLSDGWAWSHIYGRLAPRGTQAWRPLELTPVPPLGDKAVVGWETPRSTFRRHVDFVFHAPTWEAWRSKCDLANGILAPLPKVTAAPTSCLRKDGPCTGECGCHK